MRAGRVMGAAAFAFVAGSASGEEAPAPPQVVGAVEKVCQLTGDTDWETGAPTAARTFSRFGLDASDLGYPVEYDGKLILLFGDSWPPRHPAAKLEDAIPGDAVGIVTRTAPPGNDGQCLGLVVQQETDGTFAPATVVGAPYVQQGFFNVPSGGLGVAGRLTAFFWTHHCARPNPLDPSPEAPLARPAARPGCPETDAENSIGAGVLAASRDGGRTFGEVQPSPPGFVYATAVAAPDGETLYILAAPRYRASAPYLAQATPETFADSKSWRFFVGHDARGEPRWASYGEWAGASSPVWRPPADPSIFPDEAGGEACVGEFSITFNHPLSAWLLLYNCRSQIVARIAAHPWGPWSAPARILDRTANVECRWLMSPGGCGARRNFWPEQSRNGNITPGGFYAPFVMDRFTAPGKDGGAVIYWLVSTWNPYEVDVMKTTLRRGE